MPFFDTLAKVTLIAGTIGLLVGYWNYAKPTLHGIQFEAGMCNYTNLSVAEDEISCSCGKSCTGYYPCLTLNGHFMVNETENSTQTDFNGTFYKDYPALKKKCLIVPSCSRRFDDNSEKIYRYLEEVLFPYVNSTIYPGPYNLSSVTYNTSMLVPCYGKDSLMYFHMKYALWKAVVSLAVPGGVFALGVLITLTCSSSEHKETVLSIIGLPFFIIAAVLVGIAEILSLDDLFRGCFRKIRGCFRNCRSSPATTSTSHRRDVDPNASVGNIDLEVVRGRLRRPSSLESVELEGPRFRPTDRRRSWSASSVEGTIGPANDTFVPFFGGANAPSYDAPTPYGGATAPRYDAPPPNYAASAGGDAAMPPPPSYNDVMTMGPGSGTAAAPSINYGSS